MKKILVFAAFLLSLNVSFAQVPHTFKEVNNYPIQRNKPERVKWFGELGLGLFIHWSFDVQLGSVISHTMVGASEEYLQNFYKLQETFNPQKFEPKDWARLAKVADFQYVVFTTKHHNGFCMYDTKTTDFNVMNTPFGRDVTKEVFDAFRAEGFPIGVYYGPEDWKFLHEQGVPISRNVKTKANPENNPELSAYLKSHLKELFTNYGKIDMVFLDGLSRTSYQNTEFANYCWDLNPDVVVTRGAMQTPEQKLPNKPLAEVWEGNLTIGSQWQYKPTNEYYKSGTDLINILLETRAKNGNLLLNVGPTTDGEIPMEQENILRELGLWLLINNRAVIGTKPYDVVKQDNIYFTQSSDGKSLFASVTRTKWGHAKRKEIFIKGVNVEEGGEVSILGHNGKIVEYNRELDATVYWENTKKGVFISAVRGQRIYNDFRWPNPVVVEIKGFKKL